MYAKNIFFVTTSLIIFSFEEQIEHTNRIEKKIIVTCDGNSMCKYQE